MTLKEKGFDHMPIKKKAWVVSLKKYVWFYDLKNDHITLKEEGLIIWPKT